MFLKLLTFFTPWVLKRILLTKWFGYSLHPDARIGLAWVFPKHLTMAAGARIDHFTIAIHLDEIKMDQNSIIGRSNWITGLSTKSQSPHFNHQSNRRAELIIGEASAITKNHHIDCTDLIHIGKFTTIAGYNSQFLTHSIDIMESRQHSAPIYIGDYAFVGTNVVVLGGSRLPDYSVLGAKSLLNKDYSKDWTLYGGVPAKELQEISKEAKYFSRTEGFVY